MACSQTSPAVSDSPSRSLCPVGEVGFLGKSYYFLEHTEVSENTEVLGIFILLVYMSHCQGYLSFACSDAWPSVGSLEIPASEASYHHQVRNSAFLPELMLVFSFLQQQGINLHIPLYLQLKNNREGIGGEKNINNDSCFLFLSWICWHCFILFPFASICFYSTFIFPVDTTVSWFMLLNPSSFPSCLYPSPLSLFSYYFTLVKFDNFSPSFPRYQPLSLPPPNNRSALPLTLRR